MHSTTERTGVLARLAMRYNLSPFRALPIASAWIASEGGRTWQQLEWALDAGMIIVQDGQLVEVPVSQITVAG